MAPSPSEANSCSAMHQFSRDMKPEIYICVQNSSLLENFGFLTLEDGTDRLSRNVGKELQLHAAQKSAVLIYFVM